METTKLKSNAHQKLSTLKPGTTLEAKRIISAFITKINRPKDKMVRGRVSRIKSGFRIVFRTPITTATTNALPNPLIWIPGSI